MYREVEDFFTSYFSVRNVRRGLNKGTALVRLVLRARC